MQVLWSFFLGDKEQYAVRRGSKSAGRESHEPVFGWRL